MGVKHAFVSQKPDPPDTSRVRPYNWNADHVIDGDVAFGGYKITGLGAPTLDADAVTKVYVDSNAFSGAYDDLTGKPTLGTAASTAATNYAASSHAHSASDINSSTLALARMGTGTPNVSTFLGGTGAWLVPVYGSLSGLPTLGTAASTAASNYATTSHEHGAAAVTSGTLATARLGSGTADATTFLRGDQTWAAPSGGSDPWSYVRLTSSFAVTSLAAQNLSTLRFTPSANTAYEFEAQLMLRTSTTTVNPRAGLSWPTGMTDGVASIDTAQSSTTQLTTRGNIGFSLLAAVGGFINTTQSWPCSVYGTVYAGSAPSGNVQVQLASETASTVVRAMSGSFIKWRSLP